jgi:hypothetical protein
MGKKSTYWTLTWSAFPAIWGGSRPTALVLVSTGRRGHTRGSFHAHIVSSTPIAAIGSAVVAIRKCLTR